MDLPRDLEAVTRDPGRGTDPVLKMLDRQIHAYDMVEGTVICETGDSNITWKHLGRWDEVSSPNRCPACIEALRR